MWDATKQAWVAVSPSDKLDKPLVGTPLSAVWIQDGIHLYYQVSADGQATEYLVVGTLTSNHHHPSIDAQCIESIFVVSRPIRKEIRPRNPFHYPLESTEVHKGSRFTP